MESVAMIFLKNCWYVGAKADELDEAVVGRKICDQLIAIFRKEDGSIAALEDRCPHRFVPLSMGRREGNNLRCAYHGLVFDAQGQCVEKPGGQDENPTPMCVRAYPAVQRHGYIWLWMGNPELADTEKIPDFSFITDPAFACATGYLNVKAHHELIADNLLDLSHVQFLHPEIASSNKWSDFKNSVIVEGHTVFSMLSRPNMVPGSMQRLLWDSPSERADGRGDIRWNAPSVLYGNTGFAEIGEDIETTGCLQPSAHLLTPETENSTHYFWVAGRNSKLDDPEIHEMVRQGVSNVFTLQDAPIIESQQRAMGGSVDFLSHNPTILKADAAGIRARRILRKLIQEEQNQEAAFST
jgi:phenylpropionate dioxygenase-like ring-hydroxylating dioxygenase large terminal subunit